MATLSATAAKAPKQQTRIGLLTCVAFAVGNMVGAGVFVLSGTAVRDAGPAALVSFGLAGGSVLLSALSFSIVASLAKEGEPGYAYVGRAINPFFGFLASWAFYIEGITGAAFVLSSFGIYLQQYFFPGGVSLAYSLGAALVITLVNLGPASAVGKAETVLVGVKISILLLLIVAGLSHFSLAAFTPFVPNGPGPVFKQSGQLFVAFLGFSVVTSMAGDVRNAAKTVPIAILLSMLIVALIYAGTVVALLMAHLPSYNESSVAKAAEVLIGPLGQTLVAVGALLSILSSANGSVLASSEIMVRLAANADVPCVTGRMKNGHPIASVLLGALVYFTLLLTGKTGTIVSISNVTAICMMLLINIAAFIALRKKEVYAKWYPYGLIVPVLGSLTAFAQLTEIGWQAITAGIALVAAGSILFSLRKRLYEKEIQRELQERIQYNDGPAGRALSDWGQKDVLGKQILKTRAAS